MPALLLWATHRVSVSRQLGSRPATRECANRPLVFAGLHFCMLATSVRASIRLNGPFRFDLPFHFPTGVRMNKESVPPLERLAYHEAGHVLMAIDKRIEVFELTIPNRALRRRSKFGTLASLGNLASYHWPDACRILDRYVMFRLAGPAAECARIERQHGMASGADEQVAGFATVFQACPLRLSPRFRHIFRIDLRMAGTRYRH